MDAFLLFSERPTPVTMGDRAIERLAPTPNNLSAEWFFWGEPVLEFHALSRSLWGLSAFFSLTLRGKSPVRHPSSTCFLTVTQHC